MEEGTIWNDLFIGGLNVMDLRRISVALEHSVTVRQRVLARDFSFNIGGGGGGG